MKNIVFIHGAWVTPKCWEPFMSYFKMQGFGVQAPAWPYKDASVKEQNESPRPELAHLGIQEIVDHYIEIIKRFPEPPVIVGHSYGGLFVQMILDRGYGKAGIAIDSVGPKGVFSFYPSVLKGMHLPVTTPYGWKKILRIPFKSFTYSFTHVLPEDEQRRIYDEYVVPETGRIFWQTALSMFNDVTRVNFDNPDRTPLLFIAGKEDHVTPAKMSLSNFKKYANSRAKTDYKEFPGRSHWIIAAPGWEEVAEFCRTWIEDVA